ncbi:MAG: GNAT family N-acetyltransferase [Proteobacteria bacterium]|nr:GNAT family N-acetyltransferase [Pseudomonadota bacterium]
MKIHHGFYQIDELANPFYKLQELVFPSLNLKWAYRNDLVPPNVVPFGIFENERAVSILNTTTMDLIVGDTLTKAMQLGTVATNPKFRGRGLGAKLMNHALEYYSGLTDAVFLFANDTVLEYYPKFGFEPIDEYLFYLDLSDPLKQTSFRKLNPDRPLDKRILFEKFDNRIPVSKTFGIADYSTLAKWYCLKFFKEDLWYSEPLDTVLVAKAEKSRVVIHDVVSNKLRKDFFKYFSWPGATQAILQFIPDMFEGNFSAAIDTGSDTLFAMGDFNWVDKTVKIPTLART